MFYLLVKGKKRRFTRGEVLNGKRVAAIWKGTENGMIQIWPSGDVAHKIRVALPQEGSIEWAYWVHALDALAKYDCTTNNYMRFGTSDGFYYYLQKSYDGSVPYIVNGSVLELELGEDGVPIDSLGTHISVQAKIRQREYENEYQVETGGTSPPDAIFDLPFISNTYLKCSIYKGRKKKGVGAEITIKSLPGGQELARWHWETHEHKRGWKGKPFVDMISDYNWAGAPKWQKGSAKMYAGALQMGISQQYMMSCSLSRVAFRFPSFSRTFKLKIISVE